MKLNKKVLANAQNFFKSIKADDKIAIIHDADPDGICSAVLTAHLLKRLKNKKPALMMGGRQEWLTSNSILKKNKITKVIFLDISGDQFPKEIKQMAKFADVIIIDHHKLETKHIAKNVLIYKPQFVCPGFDPSQYSTTKLVYDLGITLVDLSDLDWIAAIGVISDATARSWKPFLKKVFKKHKLSTKKDYWKSKPGQVSGAIHSSLTYNPSNVSKCFDVVNKAKNYSDIIKKLGKYKKIIDAEITNWIRLAKKKANYYDDLQLTFYMIKPKYGIQSPISSILSFKKVHQTFIIANVKDKIVSISARRQDGKVRLNDMLQDIAKPLGGSGGGHIPAAGAHIPRVKMAQFKLALLKALRSSKYAKRR